MQENRIEKLEILTIKLEATVSNLNEKITTISNVMTGINELVNSIALLNSRTDRLEKDMQSLAQMIRDVNDSVASSTSHKFDKLSDEFTNLEKKGLARAYKFLGIGMTVITIVFGYIYKDMKFCISEQRQNVEKISTLKTDVAVLHKELEDIKR